MMLISSKSNPKVKSARALKTRKGREQAQAFVVEGIRPVGEAIEAGIELEALFYAPSLLHSSYANELLATQEARGLPCYGLTEEVFATIADKENPQGLLAVVKAPRKNLVDFTPDNFPWGVALVAPQDPGNIGTILRTLDAVGASGLLLLDDPRSDQHCAEAFHPSAVRASMGAIFWIPVIHHYQPGDDSPLDFSQFIAWANQHAYHVYGTSAHASLDMGDIEAYQVPAILLLGSEQKGLTNEQSDACEYLLRLPMRGRSTSLNLAVAAGVFLYDMLGKMHG